MSKLSSEELQQLKSALPALNDTFDMAAKAILDIYHNSNFEEIVEWKSDNSPLTLADKKANDIIVSKLQEVFPDDAILSEEIADDKSRLNKRRCWILDPLDGTKEFIKRNGEFTINLALSVDGVAVFGIIDVPVSNTRYYAIEGEGAFVRNGDESFKQIRVRDVKDELTIVQSRSHGADLSAYISHYAERITHKKSMGSSLKGMLIAGGEADIYIRNGLTMEWDTAAMQIIVEEAGGIFRQLNGDSMLYNRIDSLNSNGFYIINDITLKPNELGLKNAD